MKKCFKYCFLILMSLASQNLFAENFSFEVEHPSAYYPLPYPSLDLNVIDSVKVITRKLEGSTKLELSKVRLVFANAPDLVASNFKRTDGDIYVAIVNDAWVFRQLEVHVIAGGNKGFYDSGDLHVAVFVVDNFNYLGSPDHYHDNPMLFVDGRMVNQTPNKVADITSLKVYNKKLTLKLAQRAVANSTDGNFSQSFKVNANWLGHGEADIYVPTPFPPEEHLNFKAVRLNTETTDGGRTYFFSITYTDQFGSTNTTQMEELGTYLDQYFPPIF